MKKITSLLMSLTMALSIFGGTAFASTQPTNLNTSDKVLLERLVMAEAGAEPYAGQVAVAVVILNRTESGQFPTTVRNVILQKGQFESVSNGLIYNETPTTSVVKAVNEALTEDRSKGAGSLFFYNPSKMAKPSNFFNSLPTTIIIGHHVFKK